MIFGIFLLRNWEKNTTPYEKRALGSLKSFRARKFALANHAMAGWALYLALESLVLGITGKYALWRGLEVATGVVPKLRATPGACHRTTRSGRSQTLGTRPRGLQTPKAIAGAEVALE